ncbi:MAG: hypothetical protein AAFZ18_24365, partial [Myxococcota bacterium]
MDLERRASDTILNSIVSQIDNFLGGREDASARAARDEAHLSLVQQLHDLYGEIEAAGGKRPRALALENAQLISEAETLRRQIEGLEAAYHSGGAPAPDPSLVAQLETLYADIEAAGGRNPRDLAAVCDQLVQQLDSLYRDIEEAGGRGPSEQKQVIESLVEQLHSLYAEKESAGAPASPDRDVVLESLTEQLHALYAEKEHAGESGGGDAALVESLTEQLHALYAEKEHAGQSGGGDAALVESLTEQLHALYAEK